MRKSGTFFKHLHLLQMFLHSMFDQLSTIYNSLERIKSSQSQSAASKSKNEYIK